MRAAALSRLLAGGICIALWCCATNAQNETTDTARVAESNGQIAQAEKLYLAGVSKAEAYGPSDSRLATSLESLGFFYVRQSKYSDAESQLRRAIETRQNSEGSNSSELRHDRHVLAEVFQIQGRDEEAEGLYLDAIEEAKKSSKDDLQLAEGFEDLGQFHEGRREFEDAAPLFERALEIKRKIFPPDAPNLTEPLSKLVSLYQNAGKPTKAEPFMLEKLNIEEKAMGAESISFAQELNFLADLYREEGKYAEAETAMKKALNLHLKLDGPESSSVPFFLVRLASLATSQENYAEAEQLYKEALAIQEKANRNDGDENALSTLSDLAKLYSIEKDYSQAEAIYERVLASQTKSQQLGVGTILGTVERLGLVYEQQGMFAEAEALYRKSAEANQAALPRGHLTLIASLNDLALYYERRERLNEAETCYKSALDQFDKPSPSGNGLMDSNQIIVMKNYARLLHKMNRANEAAQYETLAKTINGGVNPKKPLPMK
jgi:tetratricopeptide (TPR) repeat protein